MARQTTCPVCSAYIPVHVEDRVGKLIYCSFCGAQLRIIGEPEEPGADVPVKEDMDAEE